MLSTPREVPVIDLFAGPGGLGEGFSAFSGRDRIRFKIKLSIEYEPAARRTLRLRSFFRQFPQGQVPKEYYSYIRGEIDHETLFESFPKQAEHAESEAWQAELGKEPFGEIHKRISRALDGADEWILIGGPPCQAYSLVGRSRMLGRARNLHAADTHEKAATPESDRKARETFESDHRHLLYREYLKIIAAHQPSVFIMENVKGLLSSTHKNKQIFSNILNDLSSPATAFNDEEKEEFRAVLPHKTHKYSLHSFTTLPNKDLLENGMLHLPGDYVSFPPKTGPLFWHGKGICDGSETSFGRGYTEATAGD